MTFPADPLSIPDFGAKFNISTLRLGGVISVNDMKKMPAEDELVVFSSHHRPNKSGPSEKSEERLAFAFVRFSKTKAIDDSISTVEKEGL